MKYLGIDYGAKRIGISTSDEGGGFAFPKETMPNDKAAIDRIKKMALQCGIEAVVIGDARAESGAPNPVTEEADMFAHTIATQLRLPVHRVREAWSTVEASRFAPKGKEHDDAAAAAIILQRFLDIQRKTT